MNNPLIRYSAAVIFLLGWIVAWQQVFYAAHLPGDSFTAAIILLTIVLLQYVVLGRRSASQKLPLPIFFRSIWVGISILILAMWVPLLGGKKMLEVLKVHLAGHELSSTLLFELAVLLIVVGVGTTALITFKEPD